MLIIALRDPKVRQSIKAIIDQYELEKSNLYDPQEADKIKPSDDDK